MNHESRVSAGPSGSMAPMSWTWAGWEPAQFYRRLGGFHEQQEGNALWMPDWFDTVQSERAARALAEAGVNWVTTHFFKGFGLEAEAEEMAKARRMIENYHRHGVRVFTYIQYGSMMPETMGEVWGRVDPEGRHVGHPYEYGDQYWRRKPCANQPGFLEYLVDVIGRAAATGADGIWLDNLQADGCHCEHCQAAFLVYLRRHVLDPWRDLGLPDFSHVRIPRSERPRDPLFQQWIRFRCEESAESLRLLTARARALRPDILFCVNIGLGNPQRHLLDNGNRFTALSVVDFTYAENRLLPGWESGEIVSQHFPAKMAESLGIRIVPGASAPSKKVGLYTRPGIPDEPTLRRVYAESALFGGHAGGGPWGMRGEDGGADPAWLCDRHLCIMNRRLADFYRDFEAGDDASEVGLLYSFEAMAWDEPRSRRVFRAMEQLLLQNQVPFRYLLSERLQAPSALKLIILPHVLPLADETAAALARFVERGGVLLATGRTSLYDEAMRQRRDYALADLFGVSFSRALEEESLGRVLVNDATGCTFAPGEWALDGGLGPEDGSILEAIQSVVPSPLNCPARHVICTRRRLSDGRLLLGLINYADVAVSGITPGVGTEGDRIVWDASGSPEPLCSDELPLLGLEMFIQVRSFPLRSN